MIKNVSPIYVAILDLLFKLGQLAKLSPVYGNQILGHKFERIPTGKTSHKLPQDIVISDMALYEHCTSSEWHLVGRITCELKEYNAFWHCKPELKKSSNVRNALKGLIEKTILVKTETTDIYFVNPQYIRRGDLFAVLHTTAKIVMDEPKVQLQHIRDKKPIHELDLGYDTIRLLN
jgi:hypothetical protein